MKKLLLGTSALFGAVALFAGAANAEAPKVTLGGSIDVQAGITSEDSAYDSTAATDRRGYSLNNDTELRISVDGKSDSGLGYGAVIELEADVTNEQRSSDTNADKTFIYLQSGWGRFELGANNGVSQTMKVDASTFARATGGIDGDWWRYASITQGATGNVTGWIVRPELLVEHGTFSSAGFNQAAEDANKITYYSPRWNGFQVGLSYIPDNTEIGQVAGPAGLGNGLTVAARDFEDIFSGGLNYKNQFGEVGLALSATGQTGEAKDQVATPEEDLQSYALGGNLTWRGFTFGGSWGTWEDSGESKAAAGQNRDKDYWTVGAAYDFGPFGVSATYLSSEIEDGLGVQEHEFNNLSIGADYQLAPGLVPYIEASFFEFDQNGVSVVSPTADNDGTVVIIGTQLTF